MADAPSTYHLNDNGVSDWPSIEEIKVPSRWEKEVRYEGTSVGTQEYEKVVVGKGGKEQVIELKGASRWGVQQQMRLAQDSMCQRSRVLCEIIGNDCGRSTDSRVIQNGAFEFLDGVEPVVGLLSLWNELHESVAESGSVLLGNGASRLSIIMTRV